MPTGKKYYRKRRTANRRGKKAFKKGTMYLYRVPRANELNIKRKFFHQTWTWTTTVTNDFWRYYSFSVSQIPNFTELANVFDQYRVNGLKYTFMPRYDNVPADTVAGSGTPAAYAHIVIDPESTLNPSGVYGSGTVNILMENTKIKTYRLHKPFSVFYKPKCLMANFGGGSAGTVTWPHTNRTSDATVDHRGFHIYVQQNNFSASANGNIILDVFITVYLSLKNVR